MAGREPTENFRFTAIAHVESPFTSKFAVPRQPALAAAAKATLKFGKDPDYKTALRGLEGFSHLWVVFVFHAHGARGAGFKPSVRPPRLGGNVKVGVLATRSMHRPNPIGLSVVKIERIELDAAGGPEIHVSGHDLLDGTPVLDVKPYVPYADALPGATSGWAGAPIPRFPVRFSPAAERAIAEADPDGGRGLRALVSDILEIDPRPAFQQRKNPAADPAQAGLRYGVDVLEFDVKYELRDGGFFVTELRPARR